MKQIAVLPISREKAIGLALALALHSLVLGCLWRYRIIPPPSEAPTVFVSYINPAAPAKVVEPAASGPAPVRRETPKPAAPAAPRAPQLLTSAAPVTSPAEPVAPPAPVVKAPPAPAAVSLPAVSRSVTVSPPMTAVTQPVLQKNELSVSCTERTPPAYPRLSMRLGEQGKTVLLVELDEQGRVANVAIKTKSGFPRLDEAAVDAVKSWRCSPAIRNGRAVRSVASQPFNFILKGR
jgi:protein TonB